MIACDDAQNLVQPADATRTSPSTTPGALVLLPRRGHIAAAVAVYAVSFAPSSKSLYSNVLTHDDMEFLKFVSKYGKSYGTKEEFEVRSNQFKENLALITSENSKNENTFTLAINRFADMTRDEYKRLLGYKPIRGQK